MYEGSLHPRCSTQDLGESAPATASASGKVCDAQARPRSCLTWGCSQHNYINYNVSSTGVGRVSLRTAAPLQGPLRATAHSTPFEQQAPGHATHSTVFHTAKSTLKASMHDAHTSQSGNVIDGPLALAPQHTHRGTNASHSAWGLTGRDSAAAGRIRSAITDKYSNRHTPGARDSDGVAHTWRGGQGYHRSSAEVGGARVRRTSEQAVVNSNLNLNEGVTAGMDLGTLLLRGSVRGGAGGR